MVIGTEKLIRKLAKGYERGSGSASYIAGSDFENFILELISEFSGIHVGIQRDNY